MGCARYVGRVGALAIALGVGSAIAAAPVWAEPDPAPSGSESSSSTAADTSGTAGPSGTTSPSTGSSTTGSGSDESSPPNSSTTGPVSSVNGEVISPTEPKATKPAKPKRKSSKTTDKTVDKAETSTPKPSSAQQESTTPAATTPKPSSTTAPQSISAASSSTPAQTVNTVVAPVVSTPVAVSAPASTVKATALSGVTSPFDAFGGTGGPAESPVSWVVLAAARKELDGLLTGSTPANTSSQAVVNAAAAPVVNQPPVVNPSSTGVDPTTGTITGTMGASDPESKKLTYALKSGPTTGKLAFDAKTGAFTYTPTTAQRILAAVGSLQTAKFTATVSDGVAANVKTVEVTLTVSPAPITDKGAIDAGATTADSSVTITNTRAYVTNFDDHTITVVDTVNRQAIGTITLPERPSSVVVTLDGKKLYVSDDTTNLVYVYNSTAATPTLLKTIDFGASRFPISLSTSPDDKTLYATGGLYDAKTDTWNAVVTKISTTTDKITGTVKVPGAYDYFYDLAFTPDGKKVYVIADLLTDDPDAVAPSALYVFSSTSTTAKQIATGAWYIGMTTSPDGKWLYLNDVDAGTVSVFDTKTDKVVDTFTTPVSTLSGFTTSRDGTVLYAVDTATNSVVAFETVSGNYAQLASIPIGSTTSDFYPGVLASPDGQELYYVSDQGLQVISLVPANAFPTVTPTVTTTSATGVVTGAVGGNDTNGDPLKYTTTGAPTKGTLVLNAATGAFTYTPTAAARHAASALTATTADKTDTFTVTVDDGRRGIVTKTITVNILSANIAPTVKVTAGAPNSSTGVATGSVVGTDKDKDVLTYTGPVGTTPKGGTVTVDAKGKFVYTPTAEARHAAAATGATAADKTDSFTVTVADGHGGSVPVTVTVAVSPRNVAPSQATATGLVTTPSTGRVTGTITAVDQDGDTLSLIAPTSTKKGTVVVNADGTFSYTPTTAARTAASAPKASAATKTDSFTVTLLDGHGGRTTMTVKVDIAPASPGNHLPTAGKPGSNLNVNQTTGVVTGQLVVTDPDGNALTYSIDRGVDAADGTLTVNASTGTFTYTPSNQARYHAWFTAGSDAVKVSFQVSDGKDASIVDVVAPVTPSHPDEDGALNVADLKDLVAAGDVAVAENEFGGISAIDGTFTVQKVASKADAAAVLNRIAALLGAPVGFANAADIGYQTITQPGPAGTGVVGQFYRLAQSVNGVPVVGGEIVLAADGDGKVVGVFGSYSPQLGAVNTIAATNIDSESEAIAAAKTALLSKITTPPEQGVVGALLDTLDFDGDLVLYSLGPGATPRLAWRVKVVTAPTPPLAAAEEYTPADGEKIIVLPLIDSTYYIFANGIEAGTVLAEVSGFEGAATSTSQSALDLEPKARTRSFSAEKVDGKLVMIDPLRKIETSRVVYEKVFQFDILNPVVVRQRTILVEKTSSGWDPQSVSGHANIEEVYDYYKNVLGRYSFNGGSTASDGKKIEILVNVDGDVSWWDGSRINFSGDMRTAKAKDVVAHEFTHAVISYVIDPTGHTEGLIYSGESGALNEAYADILGSLIEEKPRTDDGRWLIREDSVKPIRSMKDPARFGQPVNYESRLRDGTDDEIVHANSGIFNLAAYKMITSADTSTISDKTWAKVFYNSLFRLSSNSTFIDARSAVISSAKAQGFTRTQIEAMQKSFDAVGITATNYHLGAYDTVSLGASNPHDLAASASGNRAYVIVGNTVKIVDTNALPTPTVSTATVGNSPYAIAVSADGSRGWVTNSSSNTVSIVQKLFGVGATPSVTTVAVGSAPTGVAVNASGTRAYVANSGSGTVSIIDYDFTGYGTPTVRTVSVGSAPMNIAVSSDGSRAYVSNGSSGNVSIVDYNGGTPTVTTVTVGSGLREVAVSANGTRALVYGSNGSVYVLNSIAGSTAGVTKLPGTYPSYRSDGFIALSADGSRGFVTQHDSQNVAIIDMTKPTPTVLNVHLDDENPSTSSSADSPHAVATTVNGSRAFVVTHNKLYVIDGRTGTYFTANIPVAINNNASDYQQVAVSSNGTYVLATDIDGKLTILNGTAF